MNNKVVARFTDGRVVKGTTADFNPKKDVFHVLQVDVAPGTPPVTIEMNELKALFFVKDLEGNPFRLKTGATSPPRPAYGRRIRVVFHDGEEVVGTTAVYEPGRPGFFIEPEDAFTNEERCYVVTKSARSITLL